MSRLRARIAADIFQQAHVLPDDQMVIWPRFKKWLEVHGDDPLSPEAAVWVSRRLTTVKRYRGGSFSGSAAGMCDRRQVFAYLDADIPDYTDPQLQQIFADGSWRHLRLQAQLYDAGIIPDLDDFEVSMPWRKYRAAGSADCVTVVPKDHPHKPWRGKHAGVELKGANTFVFKKMVDPEKFLDQVNRYFLVGAFDLYIIYLEDKNTQEVKEWVLEPDAARMADQEDELKRLNRFVDAASLPPRLHSCENQTGPLFKDCPYGVTGTRPCATSATWQDVPTRLPLSVVDTSARGNSGRTRRPLRRITTN